MNIAIFGNTNNYPLLLAEGLRNLGHTCILLFNRKELLHRPESKFPNWKANYPNWIKDVSFLDEKDIYYRTHKLLEVYNLLTETIDLVILNDLGISLAEDLNRPHVAFLTGSDLTYMANFHSHYLRTSNWDVHFKRSLAGRIEMKKWIEFIGRQRAGILSARAVNLGLRGLIPEIDKLLDEIGVADEKRFMVHISDTINLHPQPPARNSNLVIFSGARVTWKQNESKEFSIQDLKGTDILLEGFALYCKKGGKGELRLPRKGTQLREAEDLIRELGIQSRVRWLEEMSLKEFHQQVVQSDLICDQFAENFPGMVTLDSYALARPVMANFRNEIFAPYLGEGLLGLQAKTKEEVCENLLKVEKDRNYLVELGNYSRNYAEKYLSPEVMGEKLLDFALKK